MLQRQTKNTGDERASGGAMNKTTQGVSFASNVSVRNVSFDVGNRQILQDVSLELKAGQILSLLGPSGSGKSTLLRIISGLIAPTSGAVFINDKEASGPNNFVPAEERGIGVIFQDYALFPHLNVLDNVCFGLKNLKRSEKKKVALAALKRVGLHERARDWPQSLSGGEQQRVALARALAPRPAVILMDEPFSGLDARLRDSVREDTLNIIREAQISTILVTHDPEEAMKCSDTICLMKDGALVQSGTPIDLYERPNCIFSAEFFSTVSIFQGKFTGDDLNTIFGSIECKLGGHKKGIAGEDGCLCVRADGFEIANEQKQGFLPAIIVSRRAVGPNEIISVQIDNHDEVVSLRLPSHQLLTGNKAIWLRPKSKQSLVFESAT